MNAKLKIIEANGKTSELTLRPNSIYTIGRAKENDIVLNDRRVSRKHAHIRADLANYTIVDGVFENGELKRSVNKVFVNNEPVLEKDLGVGDVITIGTSKLEFQVATETQSQNTPTIEGVVEADQDDDSSMINSGITVAPKNLHYDDKPLGNTQVFISANEIIEKSSKTASSQNYITPEDLNLDGIATPAEVKELRRKAQILEMLYEMSKSLGTIFDLEQIFDKATDLIFRVTPADRVVALLADETLDGKILDYSLYTIAAKARKDNLEDLDKLTISRTITQKVMREKVALLSQDAKTDKEFSGAESIVSQGVRSTICAPLVTESNVHGVIYADRLDPFSAFTQDDLELISAVAAQTAVTVETIKGHKRLAREEVARANYSRFMPEYVVKQMLENPNSFKLGGANETITLLFADIRGFTAFAETETPERVVALLNRYFSAMSEIIFENGGTLDKYIGDGIMAIFGAPKPSPKDADNAVKTAIEMQQRLVKLNIELKADDFPEIAAGIGLHTGIATIGYIGSEQRSEYTAIGDTVNLASRLESSAKGGQILISEATGKACTDTFKIKKREPLTVKNRLQPVSLFEVKWN